MKSALGILLAISVLVNVVALTRSRPTEARKGAPDRKPLVERTAGLPYDEKLDRLIREVDQLRQELSKARPAEPERPPAARGPAASSVPIVVSNPRISGMVAVGREMTQFWADVASMSQLQSGMDTKEYLQTILEFTIDYLGLKEPERAQFSEAMKRVIEELRETFKVYYQATQNVKMDPQNPQAYNEQITALSSRLQAAQTGIQEKVKPHLDRSNMRHKAFLANLNSYVYYLAPDIQNGQLLSGASYTLEEPAAPLEEK